MGNSNTKRKLVVIGLDSCDPNLFLRWSDEGRLPFLTSLKEKGAWAKIVSGRGFFADAPWIVLNTGVVPAKHGFYNYLQLKRGTTDIIRANAYDVKHPPFWHVLRRSKRKVAVFDVPKTYPLDDLEGVQIAGWGEHYPLIESCSLPLDLVREVNSRFGRYRHAHEVPYPRNIKVEIRLRDILKRDLERKAKAMRYVLQRDDWDLFMGVFAESHYAGHQFFHHYEPTHWAHDPEWARTLGGALPMSYMELDSALAGLLKTVSDDATVLIVSVHGIETNYSGNHLMPEILQKLGFEVPARNGDAQPEQANWLDKTRRLREFVIPGRVREWINEHVVPQSVHDRVMFDEFRNRIDWKRSRAFFIPSDHFQGFVSVNLAGREPFGVVQPGAEYDAVCAELSAELKRLTNPDTGKPAVKDVVPIHKMFMGENLFILPDIFVEWASDAYIRRLHHPKFGILSDETFKLRKSQHTIEGFLIAAGKGVRRGVELAPVSLLDFAPTALHLLGESVPSDMDGRVLTELFNQETEGSAE